MAWKLVNPNITNDPSYLDPRLSDDESKISSNTTSLAEKAQGDWVSVLESSFGVKLDGTDESSKIQSALNSSKFVYFPKGTYVCQNLQPQAGTTLWFHPEVVLKFPSTPTNFVAMILVGGSDLTTQFDGFTLKGKVTIDATGQAAGKQLKGVLLYGVKNFNIDGVTGINLPDGFPVHISQSYNDNPLTTTTAIPQNGVVRNIQSINTTWGAVAITAGHNILVENVFATGGTSTSNVVDIEPLGLKDSNNVDNITVRMVEANYPANAVCIIGHDHLVKTVKFENVKGKVYMSHGITSAWVASHSYSTTNPDLVTPVTANGYFYRCVVAGTSGATEPTWSTTIGALITDGSVQWQVVGRLTDRIQDISIDMHEVDGADYGFYTPNDTIITNLIVRNSHITNSSVMGTHVSGGKWYDCKVEGSAQDGFSSSFHTGSAMVAGLRGLFVGCKSLNNNTSNAGNKSGFTLNFLEYATLIDCEATDTGNKQRYGVFGSFLGSLRLMGCKLSGNISGRYNTGYTVTELAPIDSGINETVIGTTGTTATAGAATLPANPVGFVTVNINGTTQKIPYYA